jgi:hypothetical protein
MVHERVLDALKGEVIEYLEKAAEEGVNGDQKPPIHGCKTQLPLPRIIFSSSSNIAFL